MNSQKTNLYRYASPAVFYPLAGKLIPWFAIPATILFIVGLYIGFFVAPTDFQQGEAYRIIFIHVPAAWMGMFLYVLMAFYAGIGWAFNARLSSMMASSIAITGAMFTFVSLATGAFWGKPTWGTWCLRIIGDGSILGETNLGHLVGVGCPDDLHTDSPVPLYWIYFPTGRD